MSMFLQSVSLIALIIYHTRTAFVKRLKPLFLNFLKKFLVIFSHCPSPAARRETLSRFYYRKSPFTATVTAPAALNAPARIAPIPSSKVMASERPVN